MSKAIYKYYLSDLVNPNNKSQSYIADVRQKINHLRHMMLEMFDWSDKGYILFLPNPYYAKKMVVNSLMKQEEWNDVSVFSNCKARDGFMFEVLEKIPLIYANTLEEVFNFDQQKFIYMVSLFSESKTTLFDWKRDPNKFLLLEVKKDTNPVFLADAFVFTPVQGVTILGYRKEIKLEPIILGSNSVGFADKHSYNLSGDLHKFESGTLNVPLLLYLEEQYRNKMKKTTPKRYLQDELE